MKSNNPVVDFEATRKLFEARGLQMTKWWRGNGFPIGSYDQFIKGTIRKANPQKKKSAPRSKIYLERLMACGLCVLKPEHDDLPQ